MNNNIQIIFATDNNYAPHIGIALVSLLENSNKNTLYSVNILEDGSVDSENKKKIISLSNNRLIINFIIINDNEFKKYYSRKHISSTAYYRFLIPEIFRNINKVIYSDPDVLFLKDLTQLWNIDLKNKPLGLVPCLATKFIKNEFIKKHEKLSIPNEYEYCYDGNMLMDLSKLRELNFKEKVLKIASENNFENGDMDAINKCFFKEFCYLEQQWTYWPAIEEILIQLSIKKINNKDEFLKNKKNFQEAGKRPGIIHFAGAIKPWHYMYPENHYKKLYWKYIKKSPWHNKFSYLSAPDFNLKHFIKKEIINRINSISK
jgi:lipopolysaccharide biosynthesis glycosyltransferase